MKREKKVKVVPTQEQINKMVGDYLKESSKHLFKVKYFNYYEPKEKRDEYPDTYYKVILVRDEDYCIKVTFDSKEVITSEISFACKAGSELRMLKNGMFPQYNKHKSVSPTREMVDKFEKIQKYINSPEKPGKIEIEANIKEILS